MLKTAAPQVVTLGGILAALLAIVWAPFRPYWACNAIIASCLCDMVDGRIARALGVQSQFGAELDSLADVIAFGVAPAMLAYHAALGNGNYPVSPWLFDEFMCKVRSLRPSEQKNLHKRAITSTSMKGSSVPNASTPNW